MADTPPGSYPRHVVQGIFRESGKTCVFLRKGGPGTEETRHRKEAQVVGSTEIAARDLNDKFTFLAHLLTKEFLKDCYRELNHQASAGKDWVSYASYGEDLEGNI